MVLFVILFKVVLTAESVNEILKCDFSNENCSVRFSLSETFG